ncbi:helix-turn-helix transcriptional regulator [Ahniella affigens]|nr:AraC family transcriptional regulator [Ahniella affigens]
MWLDAYRPEPMMPAVLTEPHRPRLPQIRQVLLGPDTSARVEQTAWVVILNLRGRARVHGTFGSLQLAGRQWLVLEAESVVAVSTRRPGLCVMFGLTEAAHQRLLPDRDMRILAGIGRVTKEMMSALATLLREPDNQEGSHWHRDMQCVALMRALSEAQASLRGLMSKSPGKSWHVRHKTFARLQRACLMMACHVERDVSVLALATASNFSVWYFSRAFRRVYGEPPHAFATRCRLRHAAWLMRSEWYPASEVAGMCGFDNASSFTRAFRREIGCTPMAYRARWLLAEV